METKATQDLVIQSNPKAFKEEFRGYVKDLIQSGETDKEVIKNSAKSFAKRRVNELFIQKAIPKEGKTVKGFLSNVGEDIGEMVNGLGSMIGSGLNIVASPFKDVYGQLTGGKSDRTTEGIKTIGTSTASLLTSPAYRQTVYQTYVKPIVDEYKEYRHPLEKVYEDPVSVMLDVSSLVTFGATSALKASYISSKAAKAAEIAGQTTKAEILSTVATGAEKTARVLDKAQVFKWSNLTNTTRSVFEALPGGKELVTKWQQAADTRKMLNKEQMSFLTLRNKTLQEIDTTVQSLSPDEAAVLPRVIEGFVQSPVDASDDFRKAVGLVRALADDQARFGIKLGSLTNDIIERRKFQPLNNYLSKADTAEAKSFQNLIDVDDVYTDLTGAELRGRIDTIKKFFPDADPVYMRHFFDDSPKKFSSFFLNTAPVRSFKPGFLKKSYGKDGYIGSSSVTKEQLIDVLGRQATENLKFQRNIQLIESVKSHPLTKPLKRGEKPMDGYKIFAPDGLIRFYKGTINMADELSKVSSKYNGSNLEDLFTEAGKSMSDYIFTDKSFIGVTKAKLYQVPEAIANELSRQTKATNPYMKLLYDQPLDAFRFFTLSLSPRWMVNNILGNAFFSVMSGDVFSPKNFYLASQARKAGLLPDELMAGMYRMERTTSGRLGAAADTMLVKSSMMMHEAMLNTKVVGSIVRAIEKTVNWGVVKPLTKIGNTTIAINQAVDDLFKASSYINRALINERKGYMKRMTMSFEESLKILEDVKLDGTKAEAALDHVHNWYYHGLGLTNFERRVIRRVIPFYSWMRWSTLYAYHMATEAPTRLNIIANMSRDFYMLTGQNQLPDSLKGAVPIGSDDDGTVYYLQTKGVNPFGVIDTILGGDSLIGGTATAALQGAAPSFKTVFEQATGRDTFLDRPFTRKDIIEAQGGRLWRIDPETGELKEMTDKVRPAVLEHMLRNYIPQYLLLETVLTGGQKRYTAEGLDEILKDLVREPGARKAIVEDVITKQGEESVKYGYELYKALGVNIKDITAEDRVQREKAREAATSTLKNKLLPILNEDFKKQLKERMIDEIQKGTPKDEIRAKVKLWITRAALDLKNLQKKEEPKENPQ